MTSFPTSSSQARICVASPVTCSRTVIDIMKGWDKGGKHVVKKDQNVRVPSGVVCDDDRTRRGDRTEFVERQWRCQKPIEAWQGLNLRNEVVAFLQKPTLLWQQMTEIGLPP